MAQILTADFGLTTGESVQAFKAWDLDGSNGINIDEFEKLMVEVMALKLSSNWISQRSFTKLSASRRTWPTSGPPITAVLKMRQIKKKAEMMNRPLYEPRSQRADAPGQDTAAHWS